jgi:uncharacterized protein (TIGR03437 family)
VNRTVGAPNALMSIYGAQMARTFGNLDGLLDLNLLPRTLNGTSVTIAGVAAPLLLVSPEYLVVQVPNVAAGNQPVIVTSASGPSNTFQMPVQAVSPNIFFDTVGGIVVKHPSYALVRPDNAAAAGDILIVYSTGLGITSATTVGQIPTTFAATGTTTVSVGGRAAQVIYSVNSPGYAGLYQTAFFMPAGVAAGSAAVQLNVAGVLSNTVNIAAK